MNKIERNFITGFMAVLYLVPLAVIGLIVYALWMSYGLKALYFCGGIVVFLVGVYFLGAFLNKCLDEDDAVDQA